MTSIQSAPERTPVLECREVTRTYSGEVAALKGVSLAIWPGDFVGIVGPSGSGKTTLLQVLGTLDRPDSGSVSVNGLAVGSLGDAALSKIRAESIGFVFQQFHLSSLVDVRDNVADGLLYAGVRCRDRRRRAEEVLDSLGMGHRLTHRPHQLSGGERQRVAIARALIGNPSVILADEPTGNLDTANGQSVMTILRSLATGGTAVAVITHDPELAASMDRRVRIRDGRLVDADTHPYEVARRVGGHASP